MFFVNKNIVFGSICILSYIIACHKLDFFHFFHYLCADIRYIYEEDS